VGFSASLDTPVTHILRLLHSAQAWGVVIRLAAGVLLLLFTLSWESVEALRGVTPWTIPGQSQSMLIQKSGRVPTSMEHAPLRGDWDGWRHDQRQNAVIAWAAP
jgi:hypothetical protein